MVNETLELDGIPCEAPAIEELEAPALLKIDFGCGSNKKEGFTGCDSIAFDGVDFVMDIAHDPWPWPDSSVDEAHASHFVEHLTGLERVHFVNELYRVLKPGATAQIITPHWASTRAYGDFTHQWPPVSEMWFYYLKREWRLGKDGAGANAPHTDITFNPKGYSCDFDAGWGYSMSNDLAVKSQEVQMFAFSNYVNAAQDMICTLTCRKPPIEKPAED